MCDQQRLRPPCAYAQSDQSLCLSLEHSMTVKLLNEHDFEFLRLKRGCTGSSESTLVKMPHCWKSHVATHILLLFTFQNVKPYLLNKDICPAPSWLVAIAPLLASKSLPSADLFKKGCCQLQAKVCARITG